MRVRIEVETHRCTWSFDSGEQYTSFAGAEVLALEELDRAVAAIKAAMGAGR